MIRTWAPFIAPREDFASSAHLLLARAEFLLVACRRQVLIDLWAEVSGTARTLHQGSRCPHRLVSHPIAFRELVNVAGRMGDARRARGASRG